MPSLSTMSTLNGLQSSLATLCASTSIVAALVRVALARCGLPNFVVFAGGRELMRLYELASVCVCVCVCSYDSFGLGKTKVCWVALVFGVK